MVKTKDAGMIGLKSSAPKVAQQTAKEKSKKKLANINTNKTKQEKQKKQEEESTDAKLFAMLNRAPATKGQGNKGIISKMLENYHPWYDNININDNINIDDINHAESTNFVQNTDKQFEIKQEDLETRRDKIEKALRSRIKHEQLSIFRVCILNFHCSIIFKNNDESFIRRLKINDYGSKIECEILVWDINSNNNNDKLKDMKNMKDCIEFNENTFIITFNNTASISYFRCSADTNTSDAHDHVSAQHEHEVARHIMWLKQLEISNNAPKNNNNNNNNNTNNHRSCSLLIVNYKTYLIWFDGSYNNVKLGLLTFDVNNLQLKLENKRTIIKPQLFMQQLKLGGNGKQLQIGLLMTQHEQQLVQVYFHCGNVGTIWVVSAQIDKNFGEKNKYKLMKKGTKFTWKSIINKKQIVGWGKSKQFTFEVCNTGVNVYTTVNTSTAISG